MGRGSCFDVIEVSTKGGKNKYIQPEDHYIRYFMPLVSNGDFPDANIQLREMCHFLSGRERRDRNYLEYDA